MFYQSRLWMGKATRTTARALNDSEIFYALETHSSMHNFAFPFVLRKDIASRLNPAHLGRKCFVARKGAKCI